MDIAADAERFDRAIDKLSKMDLSEEETEQQILKAMEEAKRIGRKMNLG